MAPVRRVLWTSILLTALASSARPDVGTQDQVPPEEIAQTVRAQIIARAKQAGVSPEVAERYVGRITQRIVNDPELQKNHGASRTQVDAAVKYIQVRGDEYRLRREAQSAPPEQAQAINQQLAELEGKKKSLLNDAGPLAKDIQGPGTRPGNDGPPGRGTDDGPFGPGLGGLIRGAEDMKGGDYSGAKKDYGDVLAGDAKNADALSGRAGAELHMNDFAGANKDARAALEINPKDQNALAVAAMSAGRGGAEPGGDAASAAAPGGGSPGAGGAGGYVGASGAPPGGGSAPSFGRTGGGSGAAFNGAASGANSAGAFERQAREALGLSDYEKALSAVNRGLAADPTNPALLNLRATIYQRRHEYAKALADARSGLAAAPKDGALLRAQGYAQLRGKDYTGAMASANALIEREPRQADGYALRAHAYGSMGQRDAMAEDLRAAASLNPFYAAAAAKAAAGTLQAPADSDVLFLFPGEEAAAAPAAAAPASPRRFGLVVLVALAGGLLLAFGLLQTVLAPLKDQAVSAFATLTRTGPTLHALEAEPASGGMTGLIGGQYEISRTIGRGGMGLVYEGTDRSLGRRVAIKKMREELRLDARERARFVTEAKTVAQLHHPNIVDIFAIAEEAGDVYLVFEYVDGKTVSDLVAEQGKLGLGPAAKIVRSAAEALDYAHARGVIHRDVKPGNMMLDARGQVKVMDFGIARAYAPASGGTVTSVVAGTPAYMAPEQEQGSARRESDVFSLAVCAYEMLTGQLPFAGIGGGMMLNKLQGKFAPPSRAGLPAELDPVFARAFQADPALRWRTPAEFAAALESALPAAARPPEDLASTGNG